MDQSTWHHRIRTHELRETLSLLSKLGYFQDSASLSIAEVGSGSGFSLDLLLRLFPNHLYNGFDIINSNFAPTSDLVTIYDGINIPLPNSSVDVLFSVHTIEHIKHLDSHFESASLVLKDSGIYVLIVPSSTWRVLSSLFFYPAGFKILFHRLFPSLGTAAHIHTSQKSVKPSTIFPRRHGSNFNIITEHFAFSKCLWSRRIRKLSYPHKLLVQSVIPTGIVYFAHDIFRAFIPFEFRLLLSKLIGSSSFIFILKKVPF